MFSRSFASSIKSPQDVARRAYPTSLSVRRSPACSGEHNYTYKFPGFRTFQDGQDNYAENLAKDYEYFIAGGNLTLLPYHHAIAALHHTHITASISTFLDKLYIHEEVTTPCVNYTHTIQHEQYEFSKAIRRPLSSDNLSIAHSVARAQVTAISALQQHQRLRTVAGSLIAILTIRLCCERSHPDSGVTSQLRQSQSVVLFDKLHHDTIHHILRRASGSQARVIQIAAQYTDCTNHRVQNISPQNRILIKQQMVDRFKTPLLVTPENVFGPHSFHNAQFFAHKCLELIGNSDTDLIAATRWAELRTKVQSVRRGERTVYQVLADPAHDYWVFSLYQTFYNAIQCYLNANKVWLEIHDRPYRTAEGSIIIDTKNGESLIWANSHEIRKNDSRNVQTTLMVRAMYRFIIKASRILSPEFAGVFGFNPNFIKVAISRAKQIATYDGDEASALMFAHFMPCLMTPDVHLDIFVGGNVFQDPKLYVKMSDPIMGKLKKEFREVLPSRHTGTIDRATLMDPITERCLA